MLTRISPDITDFLKKSHIMVLATSSPNGIPSAATVFYTTDSQMNLYFLTKEQTTKCRNIMANPQIAAVIYQAEMLRTAQITGTAVKVDNPHMTQKTTEIMSGYAQQIAGTPRTPISKLDAGKNVLFCITPQSIRMADYKYGSGDTIFDIAAPSEETLN